MGKGSSPAGATTTQQVNPAQVAQQPFLESGWARAQQLLNAYPNSLIPTAGEPITLNALQQMQQRGAALDQTLLPQANQFWATGGSNDVTKSPAYNYFQNMAQGTTAPQQGLTAAGQAAQGYGQAAAGGNLGLSTLGNIAGGQYLNANPQTAAMVQYAIDPVVRNFQTAVAPSVDAAFESAGRYGSGAMRGAQETAQDTLARNIGGISSNIYGQQFANERALQNQAASNYGQLFNQGQGLGITGAETASNSAYRNLLAQQQAATGLQGGYQAGTTAALEAARQYPQLGQAQLIGPQTELASGTGFNEWQKQYLEGPYTAVDRYLKEIGGSISGTQSTTSPYFQNQLANALGGITGTLGIANSAKNLGLFGTGAGSTAAGLGGMGAGELGAMAAAAGIPAEAATAAAASTVGMEAMLPVAAASGGWIICTELVRQGRMPRRYWAAGTRAFTAYPELAKRGYYVWAIPSVKHLRRRPTSLYSRILAAVFGWRAEDIAARAGVEGARSLMRGRLVTAVLALPCLVLGAVVPAQNWRQIYDADSRAGR